MESNKNAFPSVKKSITNFLYEEEANISRSKMLALGSLMVVVSVLFMYDDVFAGHGSHSSHASHASGSYTKGTHESHASHASHASHTSSTGSSGGANYTVPSTTQNKPTVNVPTPVPTPRQPPLPDPQVPQIPQDTPILE